MFQIQYIYNVEQDTHAGHPTPWLGMYGSGHLHNIDPKIVWFKYWWPPSLAPPSVYKHVRRLHAQLQHKNSKHTHTRHARTHDIHIHTVNIPKAPQRARPLYSVTRMRYIDGTHEGGGVVGDDDGHQTSPQINAHTRTIFSKSHILIFRRAEMLQYTYTYTHTRSVWIGSTRGQQPSPTTRVFDAKQRGDYVALN